MSNDANITFDLIRWAQATPHAPALLFPDARLTYQALEALTWACAQVLHDQGVRAGDVVALAFVEEAALAVALQAVARLGAPGFSLPRNSGVLDRRQWARQADARWLVSDHPASFEAGIPAIKLDFRQESRGPYKANAAILDERPQAPWQIIRGSGSTGVPKLIPVSHSQARSRFRAQVEAASIGADDCLATLPSLGFSMSKHRYGWAMTAGAAFAVLDGKDASPLDLLKPLRVTLLGGTVFHAEHILMPGNRIDFAALEGLRSFSIAGSVVGDDLRERLSARIGDRLWVAYGSNEGGHLTLAKMPDVVETPGTVGRIVPGVELEVVDPNGRAVPVATTGEVRVRGAGVIEGYWNDADVAPENFRDGWFYPGDSGRMTPDGQLIHLGRADLMMICGGINIYPSEIESVLVAHPAVHDAAAMPLRSPAHQDVPVCAVVLREDGRASEQEALSYARERLGSHGPVRVAIMASIPRNEAGKLVRDDLAAQLRRHFGSAD